MKRADILSGAVTGILICCAVGVSAAAVKRQFMPSPAHATEQVGAPISAPLWDSLLTNAIVLRDSAITEMARKGDTIHIVEFADFQCPYCARAQDEMRSLRMKASQPTVLYFVHYPLTNIHPFAAQSAMAAECSDQQGKGSEAVDVLYEHQAELGKMSWDSLAFAAGVRDADRFNRCMSQSTNARTDFGTRAGRTLGMKGTPTFAVDGTFYENMHSISALNEKVVGNRR